MAVTDQRQHMLTGAAWSTKLDTDAIHPQALIATLTVGIERLESEAEKRGEALDWGTLAMAIRPLETEAGCSSIRLTAKRFA